MKGITFVPKEEPSEETKIKLHKLIAERDFRLERTVNDYKFSRQEVLSNFSENFIKNEMATNNIVNYAIQLLSQGEDVYKVFELAVSAFVKQDKERFEIMKKLVENCGRPLMISPEEKI